MLSNQASYIYIYICSLPSLPSPWGSPYQVAPAGDQSELNCAVDGECRLKDGSEDLTAARDRETMARRFTRELEEDNNGR